LIIHNAQFANLPFQWTSLSPFTDEGRIKLTQGQRFQTFQTDRLGSTLNHSLTNTSHSLDFSMVVEPHLLQRNMATFPFQLDLVFFPSLFGLQFTYPTPYGNNGNAAPHEQEPQALLSRLLFMLAMLVLFFLLFF